MEFDQFVEIKEVQWENGKVGEVYRVGDNADKIEANLSVREIQILEKVAKTFGNMTPSDVSDRSHEEIAWKNTEQRALISYGDATSLSIEP